MKKTITFLCLLGPLFLTAQVKKPLDHSVYDSWESFGEKWISNNGKYVVYAINPQEGDGRLIVQETTGKVIAEISRGYNAAITDNNRYVVYKIKPRFKETREARIKKKKADEMPKDSLGLLKLGENTTKLYARVKSYKLPENAPGWIALSFDKTVERPRKDTASAKDGDMMLELRDADEPTGSDDKKEEGSDLILKNLETGDEKTISNVTEYFFSKNGRALLYETAVSRKDSTARTAVYLMDLPGQNARRILTGFNDAKGYTLDDEGTQVAFVAERDSAGKTLQKFYKLWYYKAGSDSAIHLADRLSAGIKKGWTISENGTLTFSKSGKRLMFGTAPIMAPKDTSIADIDKVNLDIWNYKDDYLQPQQLKNKDVEEKRSYMALWDWDKKQVVQLASEWINPIFATNEGDGDHFYGASDSGLRAAMQWQGFTVKKVFHIDPATGWANEIKKEFKGNVYPSYSGKYLLMYDDRQKQYFVYNANTKNIAPITKQIKTPLYDEENDVPDDPNPYGIVKWMEDDKAVLINDRYDVWQVDPEGKAEPVCITGGIGRKTKTSYRVVNLDREEKFLRPSQTLYFELTDEKDKSGGIAKLPLSKKGLPEIIYKAPANVANILKAKAADVIVYSRETFEEPTALYTLTSGLETEPIKTGQAQSTLLAKTNPQQANYLWGTSELFTWKAYTGKSTEGILYKPENFDPAKKYPMLVYFYERSNQTLRNYIAPAPTPSRLNIPFFVSRGYVVFVPDIWYKTGYPGQSAYDYIVSGTRALIKKGFVDSTKIGLQGQSWGGYQIAYLITRTNLYAAAWAGAPVANMTSAYGGMRWGTGLNRQFQYEKTQSRIGATLWEKPELYIQNSPLFQLPKVKTPLVIMANDADDAVPWYQGIELFTGLKRLGKPVWMLNYNGEAHNLVERKNRKDISIREQQFFDWLLKGEKPARWIVGGVPAIMKGRDLGLSTE
ncbi:S9 family peptidase [Segetibacter sp. 3557_3]|nr:S9 family peptidase [Segetibacter sp. 3557_3]